MDSCLIVTAMKITIFWDATTKVIFQKFADFLRRNDCVYLQGRKLRTEAVPSPKTSVYFCHTSRHYVLEEDHLDCHRSENLKAHTPMSSPRCVISSCRRLCSGVCYNERMQQQTVFINKIRMLRRKWRNTIGRRSTRVHMTCWAFPL